MDPVILHEPSHVSLHHLYAQSIRENMLVLSSTTRNENLYLQCLLYVYFILTRGWGSKFLPNWGSAKVFLTCGSEAATQVL